MASSSSAFPTGTTRRRSSFPAELPTLPALQEQQLPAAAKWPIKDDPIIHEGAKAAHEGVNKDIYYPPGALRPTALQKHVSFWDRKKRGVFYPWDTYDGCRALGFNPLFAITYTLAFHPLHASYWTSTSWFLNPLLPVYVARIHRAKHGSDTGTYDIDGSFHAESFHDIFRRYDTDTKGGLTYSELIGMMVGNRNAGDLLGWSFQFFLWSGLWLLAADPNMGVLSKRDILFHYDGTLYYEIEERRRYGKEKLPIWRSGTGLFW